MEYKYQLCFWKKKKKNSIVWLKCVIGWVVFLQKMYWSHNSQHLWMWLENRVFRCNQIKMRSIGCFLIKFDWDPYKRGNFRLKEKRTPCEDTHLERRWPYKNGSRNGSYAITATECLGLLETRRGKDRSSPTALETAWPYSQFDFGLLTSRIVRK